MKFSDWITQKFVEWRGARTGNGASVAEFAKQFGASQQIVSAWMKPNSSAPQKAKYVNALIDVYGEEVYSVLGLVGPKEEVISLDQLSPDDREALEAALKDAGLPVNSDADFSRAIRAFEAHGIKVTRKR